MRHNVILAVLLVAAGLVGVRHAFAGQAPAAASDPDIPISHQDRVYSAEQYSNTVSVTDPVDNKLVGSIRLGDSLPANLSPLYRGQLLVHGMGFSPDHRTIAVVAIGSNAVIFIDTATNSVKHITYVGRSPHEAFYTMDGNEVWVVVRGENYVSVLDGMTYEEKAPIIVPNGPGMTIFSPMANTATSALRLHRRPRSSPSPTTELWARFRKQARSVPTSPPRRIASKSGLP
jgi:YVTN family beta-propeller protein